MDYYILTLYDIQNQIHIAANVASSWKKILHYRFANFIQRIFIECDLRRYSNLLRAKVQKPIGINMQQTIILAKEVTILVFLLLFHVPLTVPIWLGK